MNGFSSLRSRLTNHQVPQVVHDPPIDKCRSQGEYWSIFFNDIKKHNLALQSLISLSIIYWTTDDQPCEVNMENICTRLQYIFPFHMNWHENMFLAVLGVPHNVRRKCYLPDSPAGKGAKWEWAGDAPGDWHTYDMEIQCLIEEAWARVSKWMCCMS